MAKEEKSILFAPQDPELKHLSIRLEVSVIEHETYEAKVYNIVDGDTLKVRLLPLGIVEKVRLLGIDAPETRSDEHAGEQCRRLGVDMDTLHKLAWISTLRLQWLCPKGERLILKTRDKARDEKERILADIFVGEAHINRLLVDHGYAMAWPGYGEAYQSLELGAQKAGKGIWGLCDEPYYLASSKSYHRPGCSNAHYATVRFKTLADARASGLLGPCSKCIPDYTR